MTFDKPHLHIEKPFQQIEEPLQHCIQREKLTDVLLFEAKAIFQHSLSPVFQVKMVQFVLGSLLFGKAPGTKPRLLKSVAVALRPSTSKRGDKSVSQNIPNSNAVDDNTTISGKQTNHLQCFYRPRRP